MLTFGLSLEAGKHEEAAMEDNEGSADDTTGPGYAVKERWEEAAAEAEARREEAAAAARREAIKMRGMDQDMQLQENVQTYDHKLGQR